MDEIRFDRLARLVSTRSRRQILRGLAGAAAAALLGSRASAQAECDPACDANATCGPGNVCTCNAGYTGSGLICSDIDECADDTLQQLRPKCHLQ